jgi:CubicO group peptidase (beta-lactamase class C family)
VTASRFGSVACVVFLWAVWAVAGEQSEWRGRRFEKVVQPIMRAYNAEDYAGIQRDFGKEMLDSFPPEKSTLFYKDLMGRCGKIKSLDSPRFAPPNEAVYVAHFERADLEIRLVLDNKNKIVELSFSPHKRPIPTDRAVPSAETCPVDGDPAVTDLLRPICQEWRVPAIAGLLLTSKGIEACGVVGVRKSGTRVPVTVNDVWRIGSCTKAMTATLVGLLVEHGLLQWDTTVADVFPELAPALHPEARRITVAQLLSHHAGLSRNLRWDKFSTRGPIQQQRKQAVREGLSEKPAGSPGSEYWYSNIGYVTAGAIIERISGMSWEKAMEAKIFRPLKMKSAGFGGTGTPGQIDQPWGHSGSGQPLARNGPSAYNDPVMGPAGTVHCTIQDWARFVADQLRGERGAPALLYKSTYQALHTPPYGGDYALGWVKTRRRWGGGAVLTHTGRYGKNYANVWIAPERDFALLVIINQDDDTAYGASNEAVKSLIKLHSSKKEKNHSGDM